METWLYVLVVLAFGVLLTYYFDRFKDRSGPPLVRRDRRKWIYYWFLGRYPTKREMEDDDQDNTKD